MTKSDHIPYNHALDGVRAASILLVILTHTAPLGPKFLQANAMTGLMGMSLFFCLSGYLIVSMLQRNADPIVFLTRRILRIVPAVALYVLLMVILFGLTWRGVLENLLFITNYNFEGRGRGSVEAPMTHLWSLSVEMHFYIAMGFLAAIFGKKCVYFVPPAAIIITLIRIDAGAYANIATHLRVDEILSGGILGIVAFRWGDKIRSFLQNPTRAWVFLIAALAVWVTTCHAWGGPMNYARPYAAAILVGIIMHCRLGRLHDVLEGKIAAYIARISYALYIYHPLMVFGWMNAGSDWMRYLIKRPISYLLSLAAAHASTYYWEKHWQELAKRLTTKPQKLSQSEAEK